MGGDDFCNRRQRFGIPAGFYHQFVPYRDDHLHHRCAWRVRDHVSSVYRLSSKVLGSRYQNFCPLCSGRQYNDTTP